VTRALCLRPRYSKTRAETSASKTRYSALRQKTTRSPESGAVFVGNQNPSAHTTAPNAGGAYSRWVCMATCVPPWHVVLTPTPRTQITTAPGWAQDASCAPSAVALIIRLLTGVRPVQGFRTYPSFLHFLASVTLLAAYIAVICIRGLSFAFRHPFVIVRVELKP
jgi:hypothetical protein